eukprot:gene6619-3016_t
MRAAAHPRCPSLHKSAPCCRLLPPPRPIPPLRDPDGGLTDNAKVVRTTELNDRLSTEIKRLRIVNTGLRQKHVAERAP